MFKRSRTSVETRKATWDNAVLAESDGTQRVDGYEYFPPESVRWDLLEKTAETSVCHWKGVAHYYDAVVGSGRLSQAAWTYPDPSPAADHIRGHVAFWGGVRVQSGN